MWWGVSILLNTALRNKLARLRQEEALDQWLEDLDSEQGPISPGLIQKWERIWDLIDGAA